MTTTRTQRGRPTSPLRGAWSSLFAFVRRLAPLLLVLQFSGVVHLISDMVGDATGCCDTTENEAEDGRCPPLCSSCTCAHGSRPLIPSTEMAANAPPLAESSSTRSADRNAPDAPTLAGIFLPPRS